MTKTTATPICHEWVGALAPPATARVRNVSSGVWATDESASPANTGSAILLGSSVSPSLSLRMALATTSRLTILPEVDTTNTLSAHPSTPLQRARCSRLGARESSLGVASLRVLRHYGLWPGRVDPGRQSRASGPRRGRHRQQQRGLSPSGAHLRGQEGDRPRIRPGHPDLSLIHISEPTRQAEISYADFC